MGVSLESGCVFTPVGVYLNKRLLQKYSFRGSINIARNFYDQICLCTSQLWCVETLEACPMEDTGSLATELEVKSLTTVTVGTICLEMRRGLVRVMDPEPRGVDPLLAVNVS